MCALALGGVQNMLIAFGEANDYTDEVWVLDDATTGEVWTQFPSVGTNGRSFAAAIFYDVEPNNGVYLYGGGDNSDFYNDVHFTQDGVTWTEITVSSTFPARCDFGYMLFDNKFWAIGGADDSGALNDVWYSSDFGVNWTRATAAAAFPARSAFGSVSFEGEMWVIGGEDNASNKLNDVWRSSDGITWTQATAEAFASARSFQAGAVVLNDHIYVVAGNDGTNPLGDVWRSADGIYWEQVTAEAAFGAREDAAIVSDGTRIYVIGGNNGSKLNDVWYSSP
jgi:hypothetical protein